MTKIIMPENLKPTSKVDLKLVREAITKLFCLYDLARLKVDRRFEHGLGRDTAQIMFIGICMEYGLPWQDISDEIGIDTLESFNYKLSRYHRYIEEYNNGVQTLFLVRFNTRLWSLRRLITNMLTGY